MPVPTLKIYGSIGENDSFAELFGVTDTNISARNVSDFLEENASASEIVVRINSNGGDVQEGWAIYDLLNNSGKRVRTIGEGKVYSIATIVFLAGTEREMMQNADGLIHNPYIPPYTLADAYESADLLKIAESLAQEEEKILDFYAEKTGTDKARLAEYMKNETKLSAEDMLTLGFATKVVQPVKACAYIKPKNKFMTPEQEASFFEKLGKAIDNAVAKVAGFSRLPVTSQELTDKDGKTLKLEKESGAPAVGDAASPDGTYVMADGTTIVVADGKVTEVEAPAPEETELDKANAEIARLNDELAAAKAATEAAAVDKSEHEAAVAALAAERTEVSTLLEELRALHNEWKPEARGTGANKAIKNDKQTVDVERVKQVLEKIKNSK
jgi:ATP-dependent Clp protease protease subunit